MFAHQVIDWLSNDCQVIANNNYSRTPDKFLNAVCNGIANTQKFHGGGYKPYWDMIPKGTTVFMDNNSGCRLPYSYCWFDFIIDVGDVGKLGIFCFAEDINQLDIFRVIFFQYRKSLGWEIFPYIIHISFCEPPKWAIWTDNAYVFDNNNSAAEAISPCMHTLNGVLLLLSCKNITTGIIPAPEALNRKRIKKDKQPIFSYHVLVIKPTGGKGQKSTPKHFWNNRIHLQRGHRKTYTKENPLFGKITGCFYWQPHVRGQNKDGIVMKDYKIEHPTDNAGWI